MARLFIILLALISHSAHAQYQPYLNLGVNKLTFHSSNLKVRINSLNKYSLDASDQAREPDIAINTLSLGIGVLIDKDARIELNYLSQREVSYSSNISSVDDNRFLSLEYFDLFYIHSFNNLALRTGFFLGGGLIFAKLKYDENKEEKASLAHSVNFSINSGYEHLISKNFMFNISIQIPTTVNISSNSKNQKELQYKSLPSNWDAKSQEYQAANRYKYYITDYYLNEKTIAINNISLRFSYIF